MLSHGHITKVELMRTSPQTLICTLQEEISFCCTCSCGYDSLEQWGLPHGEGVPEVEAKPS